MKTLLSALVAIAALPAFAQTGSIDLNCVSSDPSNFARYSVLVETNESSEEITRIVLRGNGKQSLTPISANVKQMDVLTVVWEKNLEASEFQFLPRVGDAGRFWTLTSESQNLSLECSFNGVMSNQ